MSRVSNIIHSFIHFPANYPVVNLVVWHLAELEHLAMTVSRGCPGRRDYSIKEECVNHMWQDLKKSGGYWEALGLPHQGTVHGSLSGDLAHVFPLIACRN